MAEIIHGVPVPPEVEGAGREAIAAWAKRNAPTPTSTPIPAAEKESAP